jgi:hypothetical protein
VTNGGSEAKASHPKAWVTWLTVGVPLVSAIVVAAIAQYTQLTIAHLAGETQRSTIEVEQGKLRDRQDERLQKFIADNLPKLLDRDEHQQRVGRALFLAAYPSDAEGILSRVREAQEAVGTSSQTLQDSLQIATVVRRTMGTWVVVVSGDRDVMDAKRWADALARTTFAPATVYRRDGMYRVTVGSYESRDQAELAVISVRRLTRPDAYVVALGTWCPAQTSSSADGISITECKS